MASLFYAVVPSGASSIAHDSTLTYPLYLSSFSFSGGTLDIQYLNSSNDNQFTAFTESDCYDLLLSEFYRQGCDLYMTLDDFLILFKIVICPQ
jgi:hypothetical protein